MELRWRICLIDPIEAVGLLGLGWVCGLDLDLTYNPMQCKVIPLGLLGLGL